MTDKPIVIDGVDVICEYCGKHFKKKYVEYKRTKHHFCSQECYHNFRIKPNDIIIYGNYAEIVIGDSVALIDLDDVYFCKKYNWRISNKGYVTTTINKKSKHLHRLIMHPMPHEEIDHINMDKLDNRKENLRICDRLTNMQNRGLNKNSSTGYNGIYLNKRGKYVAHCQINEIRKYLGSYDSLEKALEILNKYKDDNKIG